MALYDKLALTAKRLFDKYGRTVQLRQCVVGNGQYDPATGQMSSPNEPESVVNRKGLVLDQPGTQISQRFGDNNQFNTLVQQGEKWLYLDAIGAKPTLEDKLIIDAVEFVIIDVQETGPGGVPVLYMLVIRK